MCSFKRPTIFDPQGNELGQEAVRFVNRIRTDQTGSHIRIDNLDEPVAQFWRTVLDHHQIFQPTTNHYRDTWFIAAECRQPGPAFIHPRRARLGQKPEILIALNSEASQQSRKEVDRREPRGAKQIH